MIDLTYTDADGTDLGILCAYQLDLAYGSDENDFELTVPEGVFLEEKSRVYIEGTEWGGIVRGGRESTLDGETVFVVTGETWHGKLASTYVCSTEDLVVSGEANEALRTVIAFVGLGDVFDVSEEESGVRVAYSLRSMEAVYAGLRKMLAAAGGKLRITKESGSKPTLCAVPVNAYIDENDLDGYGYELAWATPANHLICLGSGEGIDRAMIHLYADAAGNIGETQVFYGLDERQCVLESNVLADELREEGERKLRELQNTGTCELSLPKDAVFDVGDIVGVVSEKTGVTVTSVVTKTVVKISEDGQIELTNEIGEVVPVSAASQRK
ncbi:siphovirus ReqiPepy6 Gp37-like family protein [Raoultibacter phocaeensis]|uniref:siphovirus ReqiPepy6 Gp37-like family protein n=1 Tax=Raoultibacter phocaeensis TaxID=2479841 RepID=UPI002107DF06|nr:siphovirus ReqiPepy6 Gp37-like family protein [Raoultibacter phocaeensis]